MDTHNRAVSTADPVSELPLGLSMALAQRPSAMDRFAALSKADKRRLIDQAHRVRSRGDMQALVEQLLG